MPEIHQARTVRILIASPSDVATERCLPEAIIVQNGWCVDSFNKRLSEEFLNWY